ncbi:adenosylmethionine-8-amino-7-oxononanoate aminotransferase [Streptomyces sp. Amel2xB2]|uniref:aminotransferase family protein n=1 Tax=Streptomyces sp. Amel2xB2 TaxID=1305829 RepID=UPI000DB98755|nr:aminotransferase class III-fold pyridoxal phosphate-dependent enzyme [Streptomyces sp. Amel2xB2]RAJ69627.1 adenosylmethionine-8-amino-7-oxononanoate aminotransferase [Streptomyces sp. Amel2xB2]
MFRFSAASKSAARTHVRHYAADFPLLDELFPGTYPRLLVEGDGTDLIDSEGHRLLDAGNHLGACVVGHGRRDMAEAIAAQVRSMEFASLEAGASHPYVAELALELAGRVPVDDAVFSFTSSGSEANEVAVKIARDYHRRRGESGRFKILSRYGSYHGSSYAATTATSIPAFREPFQPLVPGFVSLPQPFPGFCPSCSFEEKSCGESCFEQTAAVVEREGPETVAAILAEPISIPGAVKVPYPEYWPRLRELCDRYGILLIADEVVSGFGRTGAMFACDHWGVRPDMLTMAKGLTSGYVPMGATAVSRRIQEAFEVSPLAHVNTYAGHPVASAAALATLRILDDERLVENAAAHEDGLRQRLEEIGDEAPWPTRVSVRGLLGSLEIRLPEDADAERFRSLLWHESYEHGVVLRVTRGGQTVSVFFYPPLTITGDAMHSGLGRLAAAVRQVVRATAEGSERTPQPAGQNDSRDLTGR